MIEFNPATCNACGNCAVICPRYIFEQVEGGGDGKPGLIHVRG